MQYFINKKTLDVYEYLSLENAIQFNNDFTNLVQCPKPIDNQFRKFNFQEMIWEIDEEAQNKAFEQESIEFLSSENQRVNTAIAPLDDAIELGMATEDEIYRHKELRKYRILLSRVPNQEGWPLEVTWPERPEFFKLN